MAELDPRKFDNDPEPFGGEPTEAEVFERMARRGVPPEQLPDPEERKRYEEFLKTK